MYLGEDEHYNEAVVAKPVEKKQPKRKEPMYEEVPLTRSYHSKEYRPRQQRNEILEEVPLTRSYHPTEYTPRQHRNEMLDNETPMYVRPYLEDPVFLQPDDDELAMLHHFEAHHVDADHKPVEEHHQLHDLPGDPDLEIPSEGEVEEYEEVPSFIAPHANLFREREKVHKNPNGFLKQGEKCNHNFECLSGKCVSFLDKAPACMPF